MDTKYTAFISEHVHYLIHHICSDLFPHFAPVSRANLELNSHRNKPGLPLRL